MYIEYFCGKSIATEMKNNNSNLQSGLSCMGLMSRFKGSPLDMQHLKHLFSVRSDNIDLIELALLFKEAGMEAKPISKAVEELRSTYFPVISMMKSGEFALIAAFDREKKSVLVHRYDEERASWISLENFRNLTTGWLLLFTQHTDEGARGGFGFKWFFRAASKYRNILRDCVAASMFVQLFSLVSPLVFMIVIDKVLSNNSLTTLDVLVFALAVVSLFEILLSALRSYLLSHTANRIDLTLGLELFKHLLKLPLSYFETRRVGDTIARMRELENVRRFITGSAITLFLDLFFVVIFLVVMYLFSPFLSTVVLISLPVIFCASLVITPFLHDKLEDRYTSNAANQSFLVETISGIETIKAIAAEPKVRKTWEDKLASHVTNGFKSGHLANLINQSTTVVSKVLSVLLLWFGAKEVLKGNLTVGQLIAFNMLSSRVVAPIIRLSQVWKELQQVNVSIARIGDIFKFPIEKGFEPHRVTHAPINGNVVFDRVSFRYSPEGREILKNISFSVSAGEVVGVVGSTGSGKTTLVKLLQRLYVPEKGRISIDEVDLSMADATWLRRQIGVVMQDGVLFNTSIRDNITLNRPELEVEEVIEAAKLAGAHQFIMELQMGYDTVVGERGLQLSTGQRQRLAIARALANDPRMLIFDEATSSLDYESELLIQKNMRKICHGRTVFIIAHRLSTVRHADRILTLENGAIVENDKPEALLAANGRFATLHRIQEGGCVL